MRQRAKILIVDDEPFNVDYLEQELEDFGYDTVSATNGQEALEKVAAENPDLILLDIMMPLMDGFTVCRRLKEQDDTRLIPIVMMTALGSIEDRIKGIEAGADDFLTKPVDDRELRARLQTTLRLKATVDRKLGELHRIKDHFAKFVPEAVKRLVAANPEAPELAKRECDVTVLFLDISGYTRLSEHLLPERLNALIERYFSTFLDRIHEAGGDINETAGDGFMAIFQDPAHAVTAVDTALALLAATQMLNADNAAQPLTVHMGVNSGTALVGSTRFEGLRGARWTFTASGPVTNLAARLAGLAKPGEILLGAETARRLGDRYPLHRLAPEYLKNIATPVEVYSLGYLPASPHAVRSAIPIDPQDVSPQNGLS
jgi:DNA-binding response OmpR family regulator